MLPSGSSIASPECSRRIVGLSIDYAGSGAFRGPYLGPPVLSASLLSRPDRALPQATAGSGGDWEEQSHPEPRAARSFARAWRGWRAPDLPRSEHRSTLGTSRRARLPRFHLRIVTSRNQGIKTRAHVRGERCLPRHHSSGFGPKHHFTRHLAPPVLQPTLQRPQLPIRVGAGLLCLQPLQ